MGKGNNTTSADVIVEITGSSAWLTLNKPRVKNAMGKATLLEILAALEDIEKEPRIAVLVIRGAGGDFCSGMDLREVPSPNGPGAAEFTTLADSVFTAFESFPKITVAVVRGICLAGGLEIALGCDFIIAARNARIGDGHIRLPGFTPNGGASVRLPRLIGEKKAKQLLLTGDLISGEEAHRLGLVDLTVSEAELDAAAAAFVARLTDKSPVGLAAMKALIKENLGATFEAALKNEHAYQDRLGKTWDFKEAMQARQEKRNPVFRGE